MFIETDICVKYYNNIKIGKTTVYYFSDSLDVELESHEIAAFRSAPATNCDVERSFSKYKSVLNDKTCHFTEENLKKYFVSHLNLNLL